MKFYSYALLSILMFTAPAFATVNISQPSNGDTVGSPAQFVATASTSCSSGVASMGVYINNSLKYVQTGKSLNTSVSLSPGSYQAVITEWDNCGGASNLGVSIKVSGQTGVFATSPTNNSTVSPAVTFAATASTNTCPQGVASMGVYVNNNLVNVQKGAKLSTQVTLPSGPHHTVTKAWDYCGGSSSAVADVTVAGGSTGKVLSNIQAVGNWDQWGELAPKYDICDPCAGITYSMGQHVSSPSLSGNATRFTLGGTKPYSDVLWSNKVIGQGTTLNMPDTDRKIIPNIHNFVFDTDVYVTNVDVTQTLEFDVNIYQDGLGMEWGTQCNHLNGNHWDIWDNVNAHWVPTGVACNLKNGWNHLSFQVQRLPNNDLLYQTITFNGQTANINRTYAPFHVPKGWYGVTVNYQMDGNHKQSANTTYVDNLNLRYW